MWKGVEPKRGEYNASYVGIVRDIVTEASSFGIYTILDMHQDDFSEYFCGEGVPDWAVIVDTPHGFPMPLSDEPFSEVASDGYPTRQDCGKFGWPSYYNTAAQASAVGNLYNNVDGLLDSWGAFFSHLAEEVGTKESAVLGYEIINEPFAGDVFRDPKLYIPSVADHLSLEPAYDSIAKQIRTVDNDSLIFFAGVTWDDFIQAGFTHAPNNEPDKSVFAFHFYCPPQNNSITYLRTRGDDSKRLQVGSMVTEFERANIGMSLDTDPFVSFADAADKNLLSYTWWEYKVQKPSSHPIISCSS